MRHRRGPGRGYSVGLIAAPPRSGTWIFRGVDREIERGVGIASTSSQRGHVDAAAGSRRRRRGEVASTPWRRRRDAAAALATPRPLLQALSNRRSPQVQRTARSTRTPIAASGRAPSPPRGPARLVLRADATRDVIVRLDATHDVIVRPCRRSRRDGSSRRRRVDVAATPRTRAAGVEAGGPTDSRERACGGRLGRDTGPCRVGATG